MYCKEHTPLQGLQIIFLLKLPRHVAPDQRMRQAIAIAKYFQAMRYTSAERHAESRPCGTADIDTRTLQRGRARQACMRQAFVMAKYFQAGCAALEPELRIGRTTAPE